jgi:hypothetical protein
MNTQRQLALLADPSVILRAQGLQPDPWQRDLLLCNHRNILLNCSRQSGKSRTVSALALHTALCRPGTLVLLVSKIQDQARELFIKVMDGYKALNRPLPHVSETQHQLELANGSRIVCAPSEEATIRGYSGVNLLIIDEAARVPDELYRAVLPMLAVSRGRLILLSTPYGKRGFFWDEWTHGGEAWHRVHVPWTQCPRISAADIACHRRSMGDSWIDQEYNCSFGSVEGLVYADFETRCGVHEAPPPSGSLVGGLDFGYNNPFCALWGHVDRGVLWITHERYLRGVIITEHARHLPRNVMWYADPEGAQERQILRSLGFKLRDAKNSIAPGIAAVRARIETGRLKVLGSACPNLIEESKLYSYPPALPGHSRSENPTPEYNHAMDALRYLISRLDGHAFNQFQKSPPSPDASPEPPTTRPARPWLSVYNEQLWTPL